MSNAGHTPQAIRTVVQQTTPSLQPRLCDIYNAKARYRLEFLAGRTPIQALMDDLIVGGLFYRHKTDENCQIILDPVPVQSRGRPQGALNRRMGPAQASRERSQFRAAQDRGVDQAIHRRNGQGQHRRTRAGAGVRGTRRHPSTFEIAPFQLPSSSAP